MSHDPRDELRKAFYDILQTNLPLEYGTALPIRFENHKFEQVATPFVAAYLSFTEGRRASIGSTRRFQRHSGVFSVECLVPEDTGTGVLWKIAGAVERAIPEQRLSLSDGSYATVLASRVVRNVSQDGWYSVVAQFPFDLDVCA